MSEQRPRKVIESDAERYKNISRLLVEVLLDIRDQNARIEKLLERQAYDVRQDYDLRSE